MNNKVFTPTFPIGCWIRTMHGEVIRAQKLFFSGDNITVKGADGFIYEIDRNIRDGADVYVVLT
jgi:hypothetical protein